MASNAAPTAPTAEEVLALVTAASTSEPTMHQLLLQVQQAQQAQLLATQAGTHVDHATGATASVGMNVGMGMGIGMSAGMGVGVSQHGDSAAAAAMELMNVVGGVVDDASLMAVNANANANASAARAVSTAAAAAGGAGSLGALRRKSIPLSMKKQAIEWIMGPGKGVPSRAEKHFSALNWDVSASSFRKWWKNRDKIMNDSSAKKRIAGGGRKPYLEDGEEKLLVIVIQERAKKDRVTRKWIAKTAQHMFQRTNANFKASENWVTKFIRRNGLTLKRSYVTYDHTGDAGSHPAALVAAGGGAAAVDAAIGTITDGSHHAHAMLGLPQGTIEVHGDVDDDDEEDGDEGENEREIESVAEEDGSHAAVGHDQQQSVESDDRGTATEAIAV